MLPVIGSFGGMLRHGLPYYDRLHVMMQKVSEVHGRVMALNMGTETWVILSGLEEVKEFSMKESATHRPRTNDVLSGSDHIKTSSLPLSSFFHLHRPVLFRKTLGSHHV